MWQAEILDVLRSRHSPVTAYAVLDALRKTHKKVSPTTIYRALTALMERGRVHRIESLNSFVACRNGHHETSILSICEDCGDVGETFGPDLWKDLSRSIGKTGFSPMRHVIEVHGTCGACASRKARA